VFLSNQQTQCSRVHLQNLFLTVLTWYFSHPLASDQEIPCRYATLSPSPHEPFTSNGKLRHDTEADLDVATSSKLRAVTMLESLIFTEMYNTEMTFNGMTFIPAILNIGQLLQSLL
jgi:hypothetical protein